MANVPLSEGVPKIYVPSLFVPRLTVPKLTVPKLSTPGNAGITKASNFRKERQHVDDLGDLILGVPFIGTLELQHTLEDYNADGVAMIPILNSIVGAGILVKEQLLDPVSKGKYGEAFVNSLQTVGGTLDTLANPVKALLPWAGGGTKDDFLKSMGWVDGEYRQLYQWDTGNFVVDLVGEILSDPVNWFSFGANAFAKKGAPAVNEAVTNTLTKLNKGGDVAEELVRRTIKEVSDDIVDGKTIDRLLDALQLRRKELVDLLRNTPKTNKQQIQQIKNVLAQYNTVLTNKGRAEINQMVASLRFDKQYRNYYNALRIRKAATAVDRSLLVASTYLAPSFGISRLVWKHLISPTFKPLWNSFVRSLKDVDLQKQMNNMAGEIQGNTNKIITKSKSLNKRVFDSFEEILAKYNYDVEKLIRKYIDLLNNTPAEKLSKAYLDAQFFEAISKSIPELKYIKRKSKLGKEMKNWLSQFRPEDIDELISRIRETAVVARAGAEIYKNAQYAINDEYATILKELDELNLKERLRMIEKAIKDLDPNYNISNVGSYLKHLKNTDTKAYQRMKELLNYLGITYDNSKQVHTLFKKGDKQSMKKLSALLQSSKRGKLVDYENVQKSVKFLENVLTTATPKRLPASLDDAETQSVIKALSDGEKRAVKELLPDLNVTKVTEDLDVFKKELNEILNAQEMLQDNLMNLYKYNAPDIDLGELSYADYINKILETDYDLSDLKSVSELEQDLDVVKRQTYYWRMQLEDNRTFADTVPEDIKQFIYNMTDLFNKTGATQLVKDTATLVKSGKDYYKLMLSHQGKYRTLYNAVQSFANAEWYKEISKLQSEARNNIYNAIGILLEAETPTAKAAADELKSILVHIDAFNNVAPLFDRAYTSFDVPQNIIKSIDGELFNMLYNHRSSYIYRMSNSVDELTDEVLKSFENYNKERLLEEFKTYPGIVVDETNAIEELTELETKLRAGTIDDIELLRYDELKSMEDIYTHTNYRNAEDIYNEFIQEVRGNVKEGIQEYIRRLTALSQMHGFEIPFYYEFSDDVVKSMTNLGNNFETILKHLSEGQATYEVVDDVQDFIMRVSGTAIQGDKENLIKYILNEDYTETAIKDIDGEKLIQAVSTMPDKINDEVFDAVINKYKEESLGRALTTAFTDIKRINDALQNAGVRIGKDLNGKNIKDMLNYIAVSDFNETIQHLTIFRNAYDYSTSNGILNVKKVINQDVIKELQLDPRLLNAEGTEYTLLYNNLKQAYDRTKKYLAYNKQYTDGIREALINTFQNYSISWGPVTPEVYFRHMEEPLLYAWDTMLRSKCFSNTVANAYANTRSYIFGINEDALNILLPDSFSDRVDYYSNPWLTFQRLDELGEDAFTADDAFTSVIEDADTKLLDEVYLGVTADLQKTIKDPRTLLDHEFLFKTQIQEQVNSLNNLRSLDTLRNDKRLVKDIVSEEDFKVLKTLGFKDDTMVGSDRTLRFMMMERQQTLADSIKSWNAKQVRSYIDDNTEGFFYWVNDDLNVLPMYTPEEMLEAGIEKVAIPNTPIVIVKRTADNKPHTAYKYLGLNSYFPKEQQLITKVFEKNRNCFYWDGMTMPDELFTGNMVNRNTYLNLKKHKPIAKALGDEATQKSYSKIDDLNSSNFFTTDVSRPDMVFVGAPGAQHVVLNEATATFEALDFKPVYNSSNLLKSTWGGNISAIKRENKINKYLQLWLNDDYSLGNPTFRPILEKASNEELKELFSEGHYVAAIVKADRKGKPRVYRIFIENQKQLASAIKANAVMVPQEVYRNMVLAVNKHKLDNDLMRIYKSIIVGTYKTIYLNTPGFLMRNFVDSMIYKNASSTDGMPGIIDNFKYEYQARKLLEWHNNIQNAMLNTGDDLNTAIKSFNRKIIRKSMEAFPEDERALYNIIDMFLNSSASGGLSDALEKYLLDYNLKNGKLNGYAWERWYGEHVLGSKIFKPVQKINNTIEQSARLGLFLKVVDNGGTFTDAIRKVVKTHFDYSMKESGISVLDDIFWFSTYPINNFLYYINDGLLNNPGVFKFQMDVAEQSWNSNGLTWEDVKKSKYLTYNAIVGNIRFTWNGKQVVLKTGASVFDFLSMLIDPVNAAKERLNPFLSVLLGQEGLSELNPLTVPINRGQQVFKAIQQVRGGNKVTNSFVPSVYSMLYDNDYPKRHYIERAPYVKSSWNFKPRRSYFKKPDNMKRMKYLFATDRYYFGRGKNLHRWLSSTTSIEPNWYMNNYRHYKFNKNYKSLSKAMKLYR